jgi:ribosomal RNA-processing protein 12
VKESGETYRSNRAGGDVKIKDKPQPYAFIQFNSKALNKRFKKKAEKVFDTIF